MLIAKIESGEATEFPVSFTTLQARYPHTLFPAVLTAADLPAGYVAVAETVSPGVSYTFGDPVQTGGQWTVTWELRPLAQIQTELRTANAAKKIETEQLGVPYAFPDVPGVAQTRDALDRANITGIAVSARIAKDNGVTDPVVPFKDAANLWHYMTPDQASVFGSAVASALLAIALKKSQVDGQIAALTTAEAAAAFDIEAAWAA